MNVLSLFDGMSCGQVALERAGVVVDNYYSSEIDTYAMQIAEKNYPDTVFLGDVTKWREWDIDWSSIDLILAGSPCQAFSVAGGQAGFDDERGKLFFVMKDIIQHCQEANPDVKWLVENVRMKKEFLDIFSEHLGVEPLFINSSHFSALNRPRYYWSNFVWSERKSAADMKECSCCGDPFCDEHNRHFFECACIGVSEEENIVSLSDTLAHRLPEPSEAVLDDILEEAREDMPWLSETAVERLKRINKRAKEKGLGYKDCILTGKDRYLNLDASYYKGCDGKRGVIYQDGRLRMLTPLEAERLQTLPEGYTSGVSNTQRYKMIGNGFTVEVVRHILKIISD